MSAMDEQELGERESLKCIFSDHVDAEIDRRIGSAGSSARDGPSAGFRVTLCDSTGARVLHHWARRARVGKDSSIHAKEGGD